MSRLSRIIGVLTRDDAASWKEHEHPRDKDGKFAKTAEGAQAGFDYHAKWGTLHGMTGTEHGKEIARAHLRAAKHYAQALQHHLTGNASAAEASHKAARGEHVSAEGRRKKAEAAGYIQPLPNEEKIYDSSHNGITKLRDALELRNESHGHDVVTNALEGMAAKAMPLLKSNGAKAILQAIAGLKAPAPKPLPASETAAPLHPSSKQLLDDYAAAGKWEQLEYSAKGSKYPAVAAYAQELLAKKGEAAPAGIQPSDANYLQQQAQKGNWKYLTLVASPEGHATPAVKAYAEALLQKHNPAATIHPIAKELLDNEAAAGKWHNITHTAVTSNEPGVAAYAKELLKKASSEPPAVPPGLKPHQKDFLDAVAAKGDDLTLKSYVMPGAGWSKPIQEYAKAWLEKLDAGYQPAAPTPPPPKPVAPAAPGSVAMEGKPPEPDHSDHFPVGEKGITYRPKKPTPEQRAAIAAYGSSTYTYINLMARKGRSAIPAGSRQQIEEYLRHIDSYMAHSHLSRNAQFYRGCSFHDVPQDTAVGDLIRMDGFTSVSYNKSTAHGFSKGCFFTINVPAGHPVIDKDTVNVNHYESEYILPRGTLFRVDHVDRKKGEVHLTAVHFHGKKHVNPAVHDAALRLMRDAARRGGLAERLGDTADDELIEKLRSPKPPSILDRVQAILGRH